MLNLNELKVVAIEAAKQIEIEKEAEHRRFLEAVVKETKLMCDAIGVEVENEARKGKEKICLPYLLHKHRHSDYYVLLCVGGRYANGKTYMVNGSDPFDLDEVISYLLLHGLTVEKEDRAPYRWYGCGERNDGVRLIVKANLR